MTGRGRPAWAAEGRRKALPPSSGIHRLRPPRTFTDTDAWPRCAPPRAVLWPARGCVSEAARGALKAEIEPGGRATCATLPCSRATTRRRRPGATRQSSSQRWHIKGGNIGPAGGSSSLPRKTRTPQGKGSSCWRVAGDSQHSTLDLHNKQFCFYPPFSYPKERRSITSLLFLDGDQRFQVSYIAR